MNLEALKDKPLFQMTGEEFLYLQKNYKSEIINNKTEIDKDKNYVYGILGIAKLFDCSKSSANRLKKSGVIDKAIIQDGRKIIVDSEKALELVKKSK